MSTDQEQFMKKTFACPALHARITPEQCRLNREAPASPRPGKLLSRPLQCATCDWKAVQAAPVPEAKQSPTKNFAALAQALSDSAIWQDEYWSDYPVARTTDIRKNLERLGVRLNGQQAAYLMRNAKFPSRDVHSGASWLPLHKKVLRFIVEHGGTIPVVESAEPARAVPVSTPARTPASTPAETPAELLARIQAHYPGQIVELRIKSIPEVHHG